MICENIGFNPVAAHIIASSSYLELIEFLCFRDMMKLNNSFVHFFTVGEDEMAIHSCYIVCNSRYDLLSSQNSPKLLCPKDRELDIDAIYSVIDNAKQFVYVAVMDYLPIVSSTHEKRLVNDRNLCVTLSRVRRSVAEGPRLSLWHQPR